MQIFFVDEAAIDIGGVYREWYSSLFEAIFAEKNRFFVKINESDKGRHSYFIPIEIVNNYNDNKSYEEILLYYDFIGKIMGKALFDKITIKGNFNKILIKLLLDEKVVLDDLDYFDKSVINLMIIFLEKITHFYLLFMFICSFIIQNIALFFSERNT